jgi:hypothetical protein
MARIITLHPYRLPHERSWAFDDKRTNLYREAFVYGMTEIIDEVVAHNKIKDAEKGISISFSDEYFDGHDIVFDWVRPEFSGNIYSADVYGKQMVGWLCSALELYFRVAPKKIYVRLDPLHEGVDPVWIPTPQERRRGRRVMGDGDDNNTSIWDLITNIRKKITGTSMMEKYETTLTFDRDDLLFGLENLEDEEAGALLKHVSNPDNSEDAKRICAEFLKIIQDSREDGIEDPINNAIFEAYDIICTEAARILIEQRNRSRV